MNIKKLKNWNELQKLGFTEINFRSHGRKVATGAALQRKCVDIQGREFFTDIICIEPQTTKHSDGKNYHITGEVKTPFTDKFCRYDNGRKVEFYEQVTRINEFFTASEVLPMIQKMIS